MLIFAFILTNDWPRPIRNFLLHSTARPAGNGKATLTLNPTSVPWKSVISPPQQHSEYLDSPMTDPLNQELGSILYGNNLTVLFQPIVVADNQAVFAYEALIRGPSNSALHSPLTLFDTAARAGRVVDLDLLCRRMAIEAFSQLELPGNLFLNVMPASLLQSDFREGLTRSFLERVGLSPERVVIELTEHTPIQDYDLMRQAVEHYRAMGFRVALDDLGAGYSSLRHWTELKPDFVKVDRHFVQDLDRDPTKRQFLSYLLEVSQSLGCQVIAEGVETAGEHHCLQDLACQLLQGYYFARPSQHPPLHIGPDHPSATTAQGRSPIRSLGTCVATICRHIAPVAQDTPVPDVLKRFQRESDLRCLAVLDAEQRPIGLVSQQELLGHFVNPFSHSLYARRSIDELMNTQMLVVEDTLPLETLSEQITESYRALQEDFIIVDGSGLYRGMGHVIDLLREITAIKVRSARQANPLTGLPGNLVINQVLASRLEQGQPFCAVYCDLDNFKAYNDAYGYAEGDQVILALARLLKDYCADQGFVGHVGGDDFILALNGEQETARGVCEAILNRFGRFAPNFYNKEHKKAGGLNITNRRGDKTFVPLISLSMALHPIGSGAEYSALEIADVLAVLKRQSKKMPGNSLFIDRRDRP